MKKALAVLLLFSCCVALHGRAVRKKHHFYFSGFGDPFPSHVGVNYGQIYWNWVHFGIGASLPVSSLFTIGVFGDIFIPGWKLSPTIGMHTSQVFGKDTDIAPEGGRWAYINLGLDWETAVGLNIGAGLNFLVARTSQKTSGTLPYLNVGWYF